MRSTAVSSSSTITITGSISPLCSMFAPRAPRAMRPPPTASTHSRVRRRVADICRAQLEAGIVADTPEKAEEERFWVRASLAEAEFGLGDADAQRSFEEAPEVKKAKNWMLATAREQLAKLAKLQPPEPCPRRSRRSYRHRGGLRRAPARSRRCAPARNDLFTGRAFLSKRAVMNARCISLTFPRKSGHLVVAFDIREQARRPPSRDRGSRADARVRFSGCRRSSPSAHCPSNLPYGSLIGCFSNGEWAIPISASKILARCG